MTLAGQWGQDGDSAFGTTPVHVISFSPFVVLHPLEAAVILSFNRKPIIIFQSAMGQQF